MNHLVALCVSASMLPEIGCLSALVLPNWTGHASIIQATADMATCKALASRLDAKIQEKFKIVGDGRFGSSRIVNRNGHILWSYLVEVPKPIRNPPPIPLSREEDKKWGVGIYLVGNKTDAYTPVSARTHWVGPFIFYSMKIQGAPMDIEPKWSAQARTREQTAKVASAVNPELMAPGVVASDGWVYVTRPVLPPNKTCFSCHKSGQMGRPLGTLVYAFLKK